MEERNPQNDVQKTQNLTQESQPMGLEIQYKGPGNHCCPSPVMLGPPGSPHLLSCIHHCSGLPCVAKDQTRVEYTQDKCLNTCASSLAPF